MNRLKFFCGFMLVPLTLALITVIAGVPLRFGWVGIVLVSFVIGMGCVEF